MTPLEAATGIAARLVEQGHVAYLAGGCVRDRLLGRDPKDYDIATDATPDEVRSLFRGAHHVGEAFGVVLVRSEGHAVEVATFRADGPYSDGRHPDTVVFTDAEHDARRRDFTINGIFQDPATGAILDFVDGRADLNAGVIRAIGDPDARLHEDELRMLRAVRFAARYGFVLDPATAAAIRTHGPALHGVSRERVGLEVRMMFDDQSRATAVSILMELALDDIVLGAEDTRTSPVADRAGSRIRSLPADAPYALGLAAWARDRHGPGPLDRVVALWRKQLVLSNEDRDRLAALLATEATLVSEWEDLSIARRKRLASHDEFETALTLLETADADRAAAVRASVIELGRSGLAPTRLVDGHDLQELGLQPGPELGRILEAVYDEQLEGRVTDRPAALAWVQSQTG